MNFGDFGRCAAANSVALGELLTNPETSVKFKGTYLGNAVVVKFFFESSDVTNEGDILEFLSAFPEIGGPSSS